MHLRKVYMIGFIALVGATVLIGCRKKEDTIAKIYVRDSASEPVAGAQVVLYGTSSYGVGEPSPEIDAFDTTTTNSAGEAVFNFNDEYQLGQAGVAVLNIDVSKGGLQGSGIIKVEEETTSEETVYVQ